MTYTETELREAAEKWWDDSHARYTTRESFADLLIAQILPLLAKRDAEIEELKAQNEAMFLTIDVALTPAEQTQFDIFEGTR